MNRGIILFIFILICPPGSAQETDHYLSGRAFMWKGNIQSAIIQFNKALETEDGNQEILYHRGLCHFSSNNFEKAFNDFYRVEQIRKGKASFYLAKTEVKLGHPEQAIKYLRIHLSSRYKLPEKEILLDEDLSSLEYHPGFKALWNERRWYNDQDEILQQADFMITGENYLEAINLLNELEKDNFRKSEVLTRKAEIYYQLGNRKAALSEIDKAVKSDVRNHRALGLRASQYLQDEKFEAAEADCNKLLRLDPANFNALLIRAEARSGSGDYTGAVNDTEEYLLYFPEEDAVIFLMGKIHFTHKKYLNSIQSFNRALEMNNGRSEYYYFRGLAYSNTGTLNFAVKDFSMALDLDPISGESWFEKGKVNSKLGNHDDACHDYRKAYQYGIYEARDYIDKYCVLNE